jgi:glycosyltransferase involved in cell wall biosynthesis
MSLNHSGKGRSSSIEIGVYLKGFGLAAPTTAAACGCPSGKRGGSHQRKMEDWRHWAFFCRANKTKSMPDAKPNQNPPLNREGESSPKPLISVIIPTYNSAAFVPQAIESVRQQTYEYFEIIVIDDGSTDHTEAVLQPYLNSIRYFKKSNGGPSAARNLGIAKARGEFIAFQDADDLWLPEKLQVQMDYLATHPEIAVVYTDLIQFNHQGQVSFSLTERYGAIPSGYIFEELLVNHAVTLSSVIVRRSCIDEVGGFDESLIGAEDYNFYLRMARRFQFGFLNQPLVQKRLHTHNLSDNLEQMCEDEIKNLDKIDRMFPDARIPKRRLAARIYTRFGKYYFSQQRFAEARGCFQKAFRLSPPGLATLPLWMLALTPDSLRNWLLALNRKRKGAF